MPRPVSAVVFDMDGLMVDTEPLYQSAWQQAASEAGYELDDELCARFVGRPTRVCETILRDEFGPSFPLDRFRERWPKLWRRQVQHVGIQLKPEVLPFSNIPAYLPPFWLSPQQAMRLV